MNTKTRKTTAFYVETLLLTLFLLALMAVLVQLFAAARSMSRQAEQETAAALIAGNAMADFSAGTGECAKTLQDWQALTNEMFAAQPPTAAAPAPVTLSAQYNAHGAADAAGEYTVTWALSAQNTQTGLLANAEITVSAAPKTAAGEPLQPLCTLQTARYLPAG